MHDRIVRRLLPVHQLILIPIGLLLIYELVTFGQQVRLSQQRRQELQNLEQKITLTQQEQARLQQLYDYARSDAAAEEWARKNGMAKASEVPVIVIAPSADPALKPEQEPVSPAAIRAEDAETRDTWWDLFFGTH